MRKKKLEKEKKKGSLKEETKKSSEWMQLLMTGTATRVPDPVPAKPTSKIRQLKKKLEITEESEKEREELERKEEKKVKECIKKFEENNTKDRDTSKGGLGCDNLRNGIPDSNRNGRMEPRNGREVRNEKDDAKMSVKEFWEKKS